MNTTLETAKIEFTSVLARLMDNDFKTNFDDKDNINLYSLSKWRCQHKELTEELGVSFDSGATKVCIFCSNIPQWVLKVRRLTDDGDYCARELRYYLLATQLHLEKFFARLDRFQYGGLDFYIQERVSPLREEHTDRFLDYAREYYSSDYKDLESGTYESSEEFISEVMDEEDRIYAMYGDDDNVSALNDFIYRYDINDLHCGNWGVASDDRIVIFDFSGYYE